MVSQWGHISDPVNINWSSWPGTAWFYALYCFHEDPADSAGVSTAEHQRNQEKPRGDWLLVLWSTFIPSELKISLVYINHFDYLCQLTSSRPRSTLHSDDKRRLSIMPYFSGNFKKKNSPTVADVLHGFISSGGIYLITCACLLSSGMEITLLPSLWLLYGSRQSFRNVTGFVLNLEIVKRPYRERDAKNAKKIIVAIYTFSFYPKQQVKS